MSESHSGGGATSTDSSASDKDPSVCPTCGKSCESSLGMKQHHSMVHDESLAGEPIPCDGCGDIFRISSTRINNHTNHYCSKGCMADNHKWISGESHPQYKRVETECSTCGASLKRPPCEVESQDLIFCDKECNQKYNTVETECYGCGESFWKDKHRYERSERDFCSWECRDLSYEKECVQCGGTFTVIPCHSRVKLCSKECMGKYANRSIETECKECGDSFSFKPSRNNIFCSRECYFKSTDETRPEKIVRLYLEKIGEKYRQEWEIPGSKFVADFYLPERGEVIEVDGEYWHSLPGVKERDRRKDIMVGMLGLDMIRIDERETYDIAKRAGIEYGNGVL